MTGSETFEPTPEDLEAMNFRADGPEPSDASETIQEGEPGADPTGEAGPEPGLSGEVMTPLEKEMARRAELEAIAEAEGLYSAETWEGMCSSIMAMPGQVPRMAELGGAALAVQPHEADAAREAFGALRRICIEVPMLRPVLRQPLGMTGDLMVAGLFLVMKGRVVMEMMRNARAERYSPEGMSQATAAPETDEEGNPMPPPPRGPGEPPRGDETPGAA